MRSFQNQNYPPGANRGVGRGKGQHSRSVGRRLALSLSRYVVRALIMSDAATAPSIDSSPSPKSNEQNQLLEMDDSKACMVYDIPFNPITRRCNYHRTVCMAVKNEEESEKGSGGQRGQ